jgi:hypothetical protein
VSRYLLLLLFVVAGGALGHKPSDSYLTLRVDGATVDGQWDIALRDLDFALGLDGNQDGEITWGEVKAKRVEIESYALSRLSIDSRRVRCPATSADLLIDNHSDGAYAVLRFAARCASAPSALAVTYQLFFDLDPQHKGLLQLEAGGVNRAGVFSADRPLQTFALAEASRWEQFLDYVREGVGHIWTGFDHMLFLLALLLPAVLVRSRIPGAASWQPAPRFRVVFWDVVKVVTAFTLAHSITLSLATLGVIGLPARLVDSLVAASVVVAALNNLRPLVRASRWIIAFLFGLIHGFGFASVLLDLGLPRGTLLLALVGFNVGVELGQLAIVAAFLPVAYALRATTVYRRGVLIGGSILIAVLAANWFVQRAFNLA